MTLLDRFLKYVAFDTQSDPKSDTYPSTAKQFMLLNHLVEELTLLGLSDVEIDEHGYVTATIPPSKGCEALPTIGFIAHVDTAPDMSGRGVKPQIWQNYDGGDIRLNESLTMRVADFPELSFFKGHTLITTDGTTLLGADDKAGVAEIVTAAQYMIEHPELRHGPIRLGFTPDEEVGRGVDYFDVARFGADYAYTVDGGMEGELEYENFNAAGVKIDIQGANIHPGYAKNKMINAMHVACEIVAMVPPAERPEHTEGYEGFYHLTEFNGTVENAHLEFIIRDHDDQKFEARKALFTSIIEQLSQKWGSGVINCTIVDQYYNMRRMIEPHMEIIERANLAMQQAGVVPIVRPIRGGTDGSRLSYMGLPCPNIFAGGMNFHGKWEYCSLDSMQRATQTIINIAKVE